MKGKILPRYVKIHKRCFNINFKKLLTTANTYLLRLKIKGLLKNILNTPYIYSSHYQDIYLGPGKSKLSDLLKTIRRGSKKTIKTANYWVL